MGRFRIVGSGLGHGDEMKIASLGTFLPFADKLQFFGPDTLIEYGIAMVDPASIPTELDMGDAEFPIVLEERAAFLRAQMERRANDFKTFFENGGLAVVVLRPGTHFQ